MYKGPNIQESLTEKNLWPGWNKGSGDEMEKGSSGTPERSPDFI